MEFLRRIKNIFNKKNLIYVFLVFCIFGSIYTNANSNVVDESTYILSNAFDKLVGNQSVHHSPVSSDTATQYGSNITLSQVLSMSIIPIVLIFFTMRFLLRLSFKDDQGASQDSYFLLSLIATLILTIPKFGYEVKNGNGLTYEKPIIIVIGESLNHKIFYFLDQIGETDFDKPVDIPNFTLSSPTMFKKDFETITKAVLSTDFEDKEEVKIKVVKNENEYSISARLGNEILTVNTRSDVLLNQRAESIGIDLQKQEEAFVMAYYNALFNHAVKVKKALSNVSINEHKDDFANVLSSTLFDDRDTLYEGHFTNHCDTMFKVPSSLDALNFNSYLEVASMCGSKAFVSSQYKNPYYDYDVQMFGNTKLKQGLAMYFGDDVPNHFLSVDTIIDYTKNTCDSGGYLSCVKAVNFAEHKDQVRNTKMGFISPIVRMFRDYFKTKNEDSLVYTSRRISTSSAKTDTFSDLNSGKTEFGLITFKPESKSYAEHLDYSIENLISYAKVDFTITLDELLSVYLRQDVLAPYQRFLACSLNPSQIKDGYKCNSATAETTNVGTGLLEMGVKLWILSETSNIKPASKSSSTEVGKKSYVSSNMLKVVSTSSLLFAADDPYLNSDYYSDGTVKTLVIGKIIANLLVSDETLANQINNTFKTFAIKIALFGLTMILFVFGMVIFHAKRIIQLIIENLTYLQASPVLATVDCYNSKGMPKETVVQFLFTLLGLIGHIYCALNLFDILDLLVMSMIADVMNYTEVRTASFEEFYVDITGMFVYAIFSIMICWKTFRKETQELDSAIRTTRGN
ncbi:hypothetical protein A0H77_19515 [Vibrio alginolyticus]|uniref:hypothetical protein n=1 Tax=Vibrio alginolyticus TaxID=663 RepID=UPI0007964B1E|nr:hypothetical protein [Vibrio alginolyticus]KXZ35087.1 hypothetical protein A0H77_19515 [Vibrio alginolyticus]